MTIINESGLYSLILSSKLESAKRFKRWVTYEVLPTIRNTGSYDMDEYSPEMKAILMHDKKLVKIDNRVTDLENHMTIDYGQQTVLGDEVNKAVLDALGGKHSNAYNEIGRKYSRSATVTGQKRYFWLAVTADEYELPLAVEDTAAALARRLGVSEDTVRVMEYRGKNERYRKTRKGPMPGFGTRYKVRKVEVDG